MKRKITVIVAAVVVALAVTLIAHSDPTPQALPTPAQQEQANCLANSAYCVTTPSVTYNGSTVGLRIDSVPGLTIDQIGN